MEFNYVFIALQGDYQIILCKDMRCNFPIS